MSLSILVVDDNVDILYNVRDYLVIKGFTVETALNGADATVYAYSISVCP